MGIDLRPVDYVMDYSPKYNIQSGLISGSPDIAQKVLWRPYSNTQYKKFVERSSKTEYTKIVASITSSKPFVLVSGWNRRDYSGAVLAAEKTGTNLIIADNTKTYKDLNLTEKALLKVVKLSSEEFDIVLAHAGYVIVPSQLPQSTPVGISTIARVKMARKLTIVVNNNGTDTMITHGIDGYFVADPSARHEAQNKSYQKIFEELRDENRRREMEKNIDIMAHTDDVVGPQMVRIAACLGTYSLLEGDTMFVLHHVNTCQACGRTDWCDFWLFSDPKVGVEGKYSTVGAPLDKSCERIRSAAIVQVVKNSESGKIYVAAACPEL